MTEETISIKEKKKLEQFATDCIKVRSYFFLGTHTLTATNYHVEKEKFFASDTYNPHFLYNHQKLTGMEREIERLHLELESIDIPQDLRLYLEHYINDIENVEKAVRTVGTEEFTTYAAKIFDLTSPQIQKYLDSSPEITISQEDDKELYNAYEIADIFKDILKNKYNLADYQVTIDHFNDHTIRVGNKKVILGEKVKRFKKSVDRLVIHEIESHVLQRVNAQNNKILTLARPGDRILYGEGLAVYNEVTNDKLTLKMYQLYSLRLKAVRLLNGTFREIYNEITGGVPNNLAYQITYRVKRGLGDTSLAGGFPKDAFYLLGYMAVNEYLEQGNDIKNLYKVRTPELFSLANKYGFLTNEPVLLPKFLL